MIKVVKLVLSGHIETLQIFVNVIMGIMILVKLNAKVLIKNRIFGVGGVGDKKKISCWLFMPFKLSLKLITNIYIYNKNVIRIVLRALII
jgi:hypothetical protein